MEPQTGRVAAGTQVSLPGIAQAGAGNTDEKGLWHMLGDTLHPNPKCQDFSFAF